MTRQEYVKQWRIEHKEYFRQWRRNNRIKCNLYTHKCRFNGSKICINCGKVIGKKAIRCRSCQAKTRRFEKHPSWKGGIDPLKRTIRKLPENRNWSKQTLERDNFICQDCKIRGIYLHAHHIKPFEEIMKDFLVEYNQFSPIEDKETLVRLATKYKPFWDINNGIALCVKCHKIKRIKCH